MQVDLVPRLSAIKTGGQVFGQRLFEERNVKKLCFADDEGKRRSNYELRINGKRCRHSVALVRLGCDRSTKMSPLTRLDAGKSG